MIIIQIKPSDPWWRNFESKHFYFGIATNIEERRMSLSYTRDMGWYSSNVIYKEEEI